MMPSPSPSLDVDDSISVDADAENVLALKEAYKPASIKDDSIESATAASLSLFRVLVNDSISS